MATPVTSSPPQSKAGFDLLRPVRRLGSAVNGFFGGGLDGMSRFGNKGLWAGLGVGILAGIAGGGIGYVMMFAIGGFLTGATVGTVGGALKGTYDNVSRDGRRDKYANEVAERQAARADRAARSPSVPSVNHRDYNAKRQNAGNYNFERQLQQERENDKDYATYWQDRMEGSRGNGNGRGY